MKIGCAIDNSEIPTVGKLKDQQGRLIALLNENCLTQAGIAKRLGVSRERIRQLALKFTGQTGQERKSICRVANKYRIWDSLPFVLACKERGLSIEQEENFAKTRFRVEGKFCIVGHCSFTRNGYWAVHRPRTDADIYAWDMGNGDWLILPVHLAPRTQTLFAKEYRYESGKSNQRNNGNYSKDHHYRNFINKWEVFKGDENAN